MTHGTAPVFEAVHRIGVDVSVCAGAVEIARYVSRPDPEPFEAPKPYLHPLRTLAGDVVTGYRPHDHRWHKGLQLTATDVSGHNLWGGHTYVAGQGYVALDNVGSMRPDGPPAVSHADGAVMIEQSLTWLSAQVEPLATEHRSLRFHDLEPDAGMWALTWTSRVHNPTGDPLTFGSPKTRGLPNSGYAGLFWRGPRSFTGGAVLAPSGPVDPAEFRGRTAPWLGFTGQHDGVDRRSTLVFQPHPKDPEPHWFVRSAEFAAVNPSWAYHQTFDLQPGASFTRRYRVVVADGAVTAEDISTWLKVHPW